MKAKAGFTLIELLVVVTIIIILSGAALASFLNYQQRRQAQEDAANVADRLRTVQIKAVAVEIPAGCNSVTNYSVTFAATSLAVAATCPGAGSVAVAGLALTLANSVFQSSPFAITFDSRTVSASPRTINICGNGNRYQVSVNEAANVSRPVFVAGGC